MSDETAVVDESVDIAAPEDTTASDTSDASPPSPAPAASAPAVQPSVWDAFKNLDEFKGQDDLAIARRLYSSMEREKAATHALQQYQQYVPIAQQYLANREPFEQYQQHRDSFQRWLATQQQPAQPVAPAAEQKQKWWSPPEVRESFKQYLVRDESGREVISPEAPLDAKHALYEYQKYKADFAQKFLTDPEAALGPMVQEMAQRQAQQIVQEQFKEQETHQYVSGLEKENAEWLYEADGKTPTPEGLAAQQYIEEAAAMGIQSAQDRWNYAAMKIEVDLHNRLRELQQQGAHRSAFEAGLQPPTAPVENVMPAAPAPVSQPADAPSRAEQDIEFLRREASRNPSRAAGSSDPRTQQTPLTFEQRLARQLSRDGIS